MTRGLPIAVIGGGPAGAVAASGLAAAGHSIIVLEEKPDWEKPCGGGLTGKALRRMPELAEALTAEANPARECELISPGGRRAELALDRPVEIYARRRLNALLLERAARAGAEIAAERALALTPTPLGWRIERRGGAPLLAAAVVVAAGARARLPLPAPAPLGPGDWMATAGYYLPLDRLPWAATRMAIRFLPGLEGYIWSFPRRDHASVGICGTLGRESTASLRGRLESWLRQLGIAYGDGSFYAHLLPAPAPGRLRVARFGGTVPHPWARLGDAAGLVDPITGEGLYYALSSGALLAESWPEGNGGRYHGRVLGELVPELEAGAVLARRFYHGRFLGASVLERMVQFAQRSASFRALLAELFAGTQGYADLAPRLWRQLLPTLGECAGARQRRLVPGAAA
jgi:flavin-dependent dehydrogenase